MLHPQRGQIHGQPIGLTILGRYLDGFDLAQLNSCLAMVRKLFGFSREGSVLLRSIFSGEKIPDTAVLDCKKGNDRERRKLLRIKLNRMKCLQREWKWAEDANARH